MRYVNAIVCCVLLLKNMGCFPTLSSAPRKKKSLRRDTPHVPRKMTHECAVQRT